MNREIDGPATPGQTILRWRSIINSELSVSVLGVREKFPDVSCAHSLIGGLPHFACKAEDSPYYDANSGFLV